MRFLFFILILCISSTCVLGQDPIPSINQSESGTKKKEGVLSMFSGNPGRAALYSGILPGAGQLYNKTYWKIPVVLGIEGFTLGVFINNSRTYRKWNTGLTDIANGTIPEFMGFTTVRDVEIRKNLAEQNRDYALIALIIVHIVQMSDAFISRHLIEFDVSDDLSIKLKPSESSVGLSLAFEF